MNVAQPCKKDLVVLTTESEAAPAFQKWSGYITVVHVHGGGGCTTGNVRQ